MMGTTIETNRLVGNLSRAPVPIKRYAGINNFKVNVKCKVFVTIEPVMDFDYELVNWMIDLSPDFVNIGADSKNCGLPEPSKEKVMALILALEDAGIVVKKKTNLKRIIGDFK